MSTEPRMKAPVAPTGQPRVTDMHDAYQALRDQGVSVSWGSFQTGWTAALASSPVAPSPVRMFGKNDALWDALVHAEQSLKNAHQVVIECTEGGEADEASQFIATDLAQIRAALASDKIEALAARYRKDVKSGKETVPRVIASGQAEAPDWGALTGHPSIEARIAAEAPVLPPLSEFKGYLSPALRELAAEAPVAPQADPLTKAAEFALKALDEEAAAYYPDTIAHVDEAIKRLRAALESAPTAPESKP